MTRALPPVIVLLTFLSAAASAIPLSTYHRHVKQSVTALDTLAQTDETETASDYARRDIETVDGVLQLLPRTETVEWNDHQVKVDNSWLHDELNKYRSAKPLERVDLQRRMKERLSAIDERITDVLNPGTASVNKEADSARMREILGRAEYARTVKQPNAITRYLQQFMKWLESLIPRPKTMSPGAAGLFSTIAQILVLALALGVLIFVAKLFLPRLLRSRGTKRKKTKPQARIIMGETLDPDQTAVDLLSEAEALARRGELRAAIRKAYVALLLELGDRKIISLAQHKTNRDYLRAVRDIEHLYGNVKQLTDSFELHWYGLAQATETDWLAFRAAYQRALLK
ncbi:MAG TPA: DUF4129 domain-containing protein [Pyrinomonadaceae bacterium]|nr:DUF4129 domain-containing protein [Pyrinomonadaceae bacterium]